MKKILRVPVKDLLRYNEQQRLISEEELAEIYGPEDAKLILSKLKSGDWTMERGGRLDPTK